MSQWSGARLAWLVALASTVVLVGSGCGAARGGPAALSPGDLSRLQSEVRARETAFAKTMADRDLAAFGTFLAGEAVFFGAQPLRGRERVVAVWSRFFEGPAAPFSWTPDTVEVLASGTLALTSGPVTDADGKPAGRFNSVWRRETDGVWRVVFDKGSP